MPTPNDFDHAVVTADLAPTGDAATLTSRPPPVAAAGWRYALGEEIGQGGMGVVYRATDSAFGRDVAVKVLHEKYGPDSGAARRFADEARITGQLQHPAIPPVHDLGSLPDGRPFLAMKLIRGRTLEQWLLDRGELTAERGRFVAAFEQVCQALAYAHSHNVIHRDLKPANVMVGSYGEVQVMDWGLAKVLPADGMRAEADQEQTTAGTQILSLRDSDGSFTQAGSILGTPAFMPPEQAVGAVGKVDARSDVFGLGAILAVILTGKPPFAANSSETTRVLAAQGDVAECFARLDACGAEPELVALCKRCLSPKSADRPANADEVAKTVADLRARSEDRARQAELERARAEVQALEQRKRRRTMVVAASSLVLVLILGIVGTAIGLWRADQQRKDAVEAREAEAELRRTAEAQAEEIARQEKLARRRLGAYSRAVDAFANEAPSILEGHPLGSVPLQELMQLSLRLDREAREEAGEGGLTAHGEMCALIRLGNQSRTEGRIDEAEKHYDAGYKICQELWQTSPANKQGTNTGNLALLIGFRATMRQIRGETHAGFSEFQKAQEAFAEAIRLHGEAIAMYKRLLTEPAMRDITVGEAHTWLAGGYYSLAETHNASVFACETTAEKRKARLAAREAARQAEEHFATGLAMGGIKDHRLPRTRLRQALASRERAIAVKALYELASLDAAADRQVYRAEADAAYQRSFDLYNELVKDGPRNLLHRSNFAKLAAEHGYFLMMQLGDAKRAISAYAAAAENNRRLAQPLQLTQYRDALGLNQYSLGIATLKTGDKAKAKEWFLASVESHELQLREAIRISSPTSLFTVNPRMRLMFAQARAGDLVPAASYAATLRADFPKDTYRVMCAAETFGLCSEATDDPKLKEEYLNKAFEAAKVAVEGGYSNLDGLERDPDTAPLRADKRFPPLVERVKANARAAAVAPRPPPKARPKLVITVPAPARDPKNKLVGRWEPKVKHPGVTSAMDYTTDGKATLRVQTVTTTTTLEGTYQLNGEKLTVTFKVGSDPKPNTTTVKKLTDTELELRYDDGRIDAFTRAKDEPKK